MLNAGTGLIKKWVTPGSLTLPDVVIYATWISVWGRWLIWLLAVFLIAYRPGFWYPKDLEYLALPVLLLAANGLVHYRLLAKRPVTQRWLLFLSLVDVALITAGLIIGAGFPSFIFLAYYPALAMFAVIFSSLWLSLGWTTMVVLAYTLVCLTVGYGLDLDLGQEKVLVGRLAVMYIIVLGIGLITQFERLRWQTAVSSERRLRRERIELSQQIHDTTAQTAYMIDLGIHRARKLASESNEDLLAVLDATSALSRSAMWEMRGPIDAGHILEGRELVRVLWSHCATFERITAVPAEIQQSGTEPPLASEIRTGLFSIAHNALTNAFLHAKPAKVEVSLNFEPERIKLSVSDDGVGLPDDYADRGRGISGMRADAEQIGGTLSVESANGQGGTTITCVVPYQGVEGGA